MRWFYLEDLLNRLYIYLNSITVQGEASVSNLKASFITLYEIREYLNNNKVAASGDKNGK